MQIYGHRGVLARLPGNTIEGVEMAFAEGADGVEIDVRRSADGQLVCCHDPKLRPDAGRRVRLLAQTAEALEAVTFDGGYRLAKPEDVLTAAAGRGRVTVEIKNSPLERDHDWSASASATALVELLQERTAAGQDDCVAVSSFDLRVLDTVRAALPELPTGYLTRPRTRFDVSLRRVRRRGHDECHLHVSSVLADLDGVARAAAAGLAVVCWTVNKVDQARRLAAAGVAAVITDDPQLLRRGLA